MRVEMKKEFEEKSIATAIKTLKEELPSNVKLVAVSKFHPAEAVMEAYSAGQRIFGESRPQELAAKAAVLPGDIVWHFIGHLQTNKLKMVLPVSSMVESVDSLHLLEAIEKWAGDNGKTVCVLLEMHIASEETKQGFSREEILDIASKAGGYPHIRICGLMGMATFTDNEEIIRKDFAKLVTLRDEIRAGIENYPGLPADFGILSFGMTHDYRVAVEMGADIVRIGTLIFGERSY